jgi:hypothetical protein
MSYTTSINFNYGGVATDYAPSAPPMDPIYSPVGVLPSYPNHTPYYQAYPVAPKPAVPQQMYDQTLKLLNKAAEVSLSILGDDNNSTASSYYHSQAAPVVSKPVVAPNYHFDFSDKSVKLFNQETHHTHYHNAEDSEKNKDDTGTRILVGLIGLVAAGVAAFFIGKAIAEGEDQEEENMSFETLKGQWNGNKSFFEYDYQSAVDIVVVKADAILERQQTNRTHKIALLVFGFAAGGTAVAGALIGSSVVMLAAGGMGACVTVATLFKLGYACFSTRDQKDAKAIEASLDQLRQKQILVC